MKIGKYIVSGNDIVTGALGASMFFSSCGRNKFDYGNLEVGKRYSAPDAEVLWDEDPRTGQPLNSRVYLRGIFPSDDALDPEYRSDRTAVISISTKDTNEARKIAYRIEGGEIEIKNLTKSSYIDAGNELIYIAGPRDIVIPHTSLVGKNPPLPVKAKNKPTHQRKTKHVPCPEPVVQTPSENKPIIIRETIIEKVPVRDVYIEEHHHFHPPRAPSYLYRNNGFDVIVTPARPRGSWYYGSQRRCR